MYLVCKLRKWLRLSGNMKSDTKDSPELSPVSLTIIDRYSAAIAEGDSDRMDSLRAEDFILDFIPRDAFASNPLDNQETLTFWPAWFRAFTEMDYQVIRTIAGQQVVVTQWIFLGTHSAVLDHPVFDQRIEATGKTIRLRGASIYDIFEEKIQRETTYMDLSTLYVELGVTL